MDPSPPDHRTWTSATFCVYWAADIVYPATWATVASFVTLGLTWWESCLAIFLGGVLVAVVITGMLTPETIAEKRTSEDDSLE
jgi:NCS1 family nucleobase:cation symporter-1